MARFGTLGTRFTDKSGKVLDKGKIFFFDSGTNDDKPTFSDIDETPALINTQPLILNADGSLPNCFFSGSAKGILTDKNDVQIEEKDPITATGSEGGRLAFASWNALSTYRKPDLVTASDGLYYKCIVTTSQGKEPSASLSDWSEVKFVGVWNTNQDYVLDDIVQASDGYLYVNISAGSGDDPITVKASWRALATQVYSATTTYEIGEVVADSVGLMWRSIAAANLNNTPSSSPTKWLPVVESSSIVVYPQNIQSADYTLVLSDEGKQIFHPLADTTARTYTIPANASVAFDIGTVALCVNEEGAGDLRIAINTDVLQDLSGNTSVPTLIGGNILRALKIAATKWVYSVDNRVGEFEYAVAIAHSTTPFISAYPWLDTGFGPRFSNPVTLPTGNGKEVAFSPAGTEMVVAHNTTPFASGYPFTPAGIGTKFANPSTLPTGNGDGVSFSPAGTEVAIAHAITPFISTYGWSVSGFGTRFVNPSTLPTGTAKDVEFSPAGTEIVIVHTTTPFVSGYPWSVSGFGTKFVNPSTLPAGNANGVAFSPAGTEIAIATGTTPFVDAYGWSSSGFGTRFANPTTLPPASAADLEFHPDGIALAVAHNSSPFGTVYNWSASGFGLKFTDPSTLPGGSSENVAFSPDGNAIIFVGGTSPRVFAYSWLNTGFGDRFTQPETIPTGTGNDVNFVTL